MARRSKIAAVEQPYTLRIAAGCLGFASGFASKEETRYYLNGVFVDSSGPAPCAVATDGHTMIAMHDPDGFAAQSSILLLPKDFLALCRKEPDAIVVAKAPLGPKARAAVWLVDAVALTKGEVSPELLDAPDGARVIARSVVSTIDGTFPDWRKVFPAKMPERGSRSDGLNARLLDRFRAPAAWGYGRGKSTAPIGFRQDGPSSPAVVTPCDHGGKPWIGLVMPMRVDPVEHLPGWLGNTGLPRKEAA